MPVSQFDKGELFRELHQHGHVFVMPNPWDAGSARILAALGFKALATTSAGAAYALAKADAIREVTREEALNNARCVAAATDLPVSADLENGYGDSPADCAQTILIAAQAGVVGGSIEDATGQPDRPIYDFDHSVARVRAAAEAARSLPFHFTLTARAENYLYDRPDLDDTIRRLIAFAEAGADVLFAPGIKTKEEIERVVSTLHPHPVSVLWGFPDAALTVDDLGKLGVRRISTGSSLARAAYGSLLSAAKEISAHGSFSYVNSSISYADMNAMFTEK